MNAPFDPIMLMIPVAIVMIVVEIAVSALSARALYGWGDTAGNFVLALGRLMIAPMVKLVPIYMIHLLTPIVMFDIRWSVTAVVGCFVLNDFCAYWGHRIGHTVRWAWADHVNHHSSQKLNFSTALRQGWFAYFTPSIVSLLPLMVLGFPWKMVAFVNALDLSYQFFLHTTLVKTLPKPIEFVFNTPSHHRVHHASNPRYLDRNFGNVLIIWDRMFGTFQAEDPLEQPVYGLTKNINSSAPTTILFHEWRALVVDIARAKGFRAKVGYLLAPPGWTPTDGTSERSSAIGRTGDSAESLAPDRPTK